MKAKIHLKDVKLHHVALDKPISFCGDIYRELYRVVVELQQDEHEYLRELVDDMALKAFKGETFRGGVQFEEGVAAIVLTSKDKPQVFPEAYVSKGVKLNLLKTATIDAEVETYDCRFGRGIKFTVNRVIIPEGIENKQMVNYASLGLQTQKEVFDTLEATGFGVADEKVPESIF